MMKLLLIPVIWSVCAAIRDEEITHVHMVSMNHLDIGYDGVPGLGFINNVLNVYFNTYFPRAVAVSAQLRNDKYSERFIYTTHPWLVSLYLDCPPNLVLSGIKLKCPNQAAVSAFVKAIQLGDITWHAGPMNMQFEMMDPSLARFCLQLSDDLDKRFRIVRKHKTVSQRDVPGMTQAIIPLLEELGIDAVSVGVNSVSAPPAVPPIFQWKFQNSSVIGLWHPGGFPLDPGPQPAIPGGLSRKDCATFPGFTHALCFLFRIDNSGPPMSINEVLMDFEIARSQFPNALVQASTFEGFIEAAQPVKSQLPVISQEIGDTWIDGVASDPRKTAELRAIMRARSKCLQNNSGCNLNDSRVNNASRFIIKTAEHTWGLDGVFDHIHWTNGPFYKLLEQKASNFIHGIMSWQEQRNFSYIGIEVLGNHSLANLIKKELSDLQAQMPDFSEYALVDDKYSIQTCNGFTLQFNRDGALSQLIDPVTKISWASETNPVGQFVYQSYNQSDFDIFNKNYPWDKYHFLGIGKPNISKNASPESKNWGTSLVDVYKSKDGCSFIAQIKVTDKQTISYYGAPESIFVKYNLSKTTTNFDVKSKIDVDLQWFNKRPTRLPEALYYMFKPIQESDEGIWSVHKLGQWVDPLNVIHNGSQTLHAVDKGFRYMKDKTRGIEVVSYDAALLNVLTPDHGLSVIPLPLYPIQSVSGMAFNLYNNIWDTNYIYWYPYEERDMDQKFRFTINFISFSGGIKLQTMK